jgi:broad specificity phosphatase PhoE
MHDMRDNPPGWYRDPDRPKWHRYWDGEDWQEPIAELLQQQQRPVSSVDDSPEG